MKKVAILLAVMGVFFGLSGLVLAYEFVSLDYPGEAYTRAFGINNSGVVVGDYYSDYYHGFVFDGDKFTTVDVPDASETWVRGINDSGDLVGFFSAGSDYYGFIANAFHLRKDLRLTVRLTFSMRPPIWIPSTRLAANSFPVSPGTLTLAARCRSTSSVTMLPT